MKINCAIINDDHNSPIVNFLKLKNFSFLDINSIYEKKCDKLILIDPSTPEEEFTRVLEKIKKDNFYSTFLVIPNEYKNKKLSSDFIKIFYPIHIKKFEQILNDKIALKDLFFQDIHIENNNFLVNVFNQKRIHLTETEMNIIKLLIKDTVVKKEKLKTEILNLNLELDTKSLESHISRIRKKFSNIKSNISIISTDSNSFKIL